MSDVFQSAIQGMIDNMGREWQRDRAKTQMTLGGLISALELLSPDTKISGFGFPMSYRGYYCDLAFDPLGRSETVSELLDRARSCMGRVFEGYKGGDFVMGETTPVWISDYGMSSGLRLMGLTDGDPVNPILSKEVGDE